jgi:hypothetical protein
MWADMGVHLMAQPRRMDICLWQYLSIQQGATWLLCNWMNNIQLKGCSWQTVHLAGRIMYVDPLKLSATGMEGLALL